MSNIQKKKELVGIYTLNQLYEMLPENVSKKLGITEHTGKMRANVDISRRKIDSKYKRQGELKPLMYIEKEARTQILNGHPENTPLYQYVNSLQNKQAPAQWSYYALFKDNTIYNVDPACRKVFISKRLQYDKRKNVAVVKDIFNDRHYLPCEQIDNEILTELKDERAVPYWCR